MIKDIIKTMRLGLGLSQRGFARAIGTVQSVVSDYECGDKQPSYSALVALNELSIRHNLNINFLEKCDEVKSVEEEVRE